MEKNEVALRLQALAANSSLKSETARLREIFADVENTLNSGVPQSAVLGELKASGYTMTMASFKSALQRIRKEKVKLKGEKVNTNVTANKAINCEQFGKKNDDFGKNDGQNGTLAASGMSSSNPLITAGIGKALTAEDLEPVVKLTYPLEED